MLVAMLRVMLSIARPRSALEKVKEISGENLYGCKFRGKYWT